MPSLRERMDDVPLLAEHFVHRYERLPGRRMWPLPRETMDFLLSWPGNIRQLENAIERAVHFSDGGPLMPQHFSMDPRMTSVGYRAEPGSSIESLADMENRAIAQAMAALGGNLARVASHLASAGRGCTENFGATACAKSGLSGMGGQREGRFVSCGS